MWGLSRCIPSALRDKRWRKIVPPRSRGAESSLRLSTPMKTSAQTIFAWFADAVLVALAAFLTAAGSVVADASSEIASPMRPLIIVRDLARAASTEAPCPNSKRGKGERN